VIWGILSFCFVFGHDCGVAWCCPSRHFLVLLFVLKFCMDNDALFIKQS
jgi:hypothetical protein